MPLRFLFVDGRLGEPAWAAAPVVADFVQKEPNEGAEPSVTVTPMHS